MSEIDLDAMERRIRQMSARRLDTDEQLALIELVRSERARADAAEAERAEVAAAMLLVYDGRESWRARALAAEPIAAAMEGVTASEAERARAAIGSMRFPGVAYALERLAVYRREEHAALRAQDEPKRFPTDGFDPPDGRAYTVGAAIGLRWDEPKRESLDCFICGAPWDSPGACQCGRREEPKREPPETRTCRLCNGEPIAPWPPVPGGGPTHHTCHPGEERKREPSGGDHG